MLETQIRTFIDEVLSSIIDPELRELVEQKTFLTGGCFKSLYHNEKVNDYDFYFVDNESALKFKQLINKGLEQNSNNPFTVQEKLRVKNWCGDYSQTKFAVTFMFKVDIKIQFIIKYSGDPEKVVNNFDFLHTQNYYILKNNKFCINYENLNGKQLIFNKKASHPVNGLQRLVKFLGQGWTITNNELIKIAECINKLNLDEFSKWEEQTLSMYTDFQQSGIVVFNDIVADDKTKKNLIKWVD